MRICLNLKIRNQRLNLKRNPLKNKLSQRKAPKKSQPLKLRRNKKNRPNLKPLKNHQKLNWRKVNQWFRRQNSSSCLAKRNQLQMKMMQLESSIQVSIHRIPNLRWPKVTASSTVCWQKKKPQNSQSRAKSQKNDPIISSKIIIPTAQKNTHKNLISQFELVRLPKFLVKSYHFVTIIIIWITPLNNNKILEVQAPLPRKMKTSMTMVFKVIMNSRNKFCIRVRKIGDNCFKLIMKK